jgi:hypothetical protein
MRESEGGHGTAFWQVDSQVDTSIHWQGDFPLLVQIPHQRGQQRTPEKPEAIHPLFPG